MLATARAVAGMVEEEMAMVVAAKAKAVGVMVMLLGLVGVVREVERASMVAA